VLLKVKFSMNQIMDNIIEPSESFDFSQITLAQPVGIQGGAYFTKLLLNGKSLYIQTPKSLTRQGFVKSGKKIYCDLMFDNGNDVFIQWIENLEEKCQNLIYEKSESWFQNSLDKNDIESAFNSPIKVYKSGKFYLLKTNIKMNNLTNAPVIRIFNENETIMGMDDINSETNIISILEIQGIKFTTRNFQIEMELKQVMILNTDLIFESCIIKKTNKSQIDFKKENDTELGNFIKIKTLTDNNDININTIHNKENIRQHNLDKISNQILEDLENNIENSQIESKTILKDDNILEDFDNKILDNIDNKDIIKLNPKRNYDNSDDEDEDEDEDEDGDDEDEDDEDEDEDEDDDDDEDKDDKNNITNDVNKKEKNLKDENVVENINLEIEDLDKIDSKELSEMNELDLSLDLDNNLEIMTLKKPNQVYYEIYKEARKKAKEAKQTAVLAYLEAKNIKNTYMLDVITSSDESSIENYSDEEELLE